MNRVYIYSCAHMLGIVMVGLVMQFLVKENDSNLSRFLAGFMVGSYALFGKAIAKLGFRCLLKRCVPVFDKSNFVNWLTIITLVIVGCGGGLFAWYVSWEGHTTIYFGMAVFLAAILADLGFEPLFQEFSPH